MSVNGGRWPTFFVAGAPKAGTTALYEFLRQHPGVYMSPIKEPNFFARADLVSGPWRDQTLRAIELDRPQLAQYFAGPMTEPCYWRLVLDEADYVRLFGGASDRQAIGEASVTYFWRPSAAASIAARVPHARLIFLLRHPADRTLSEYLVSMHGRPGATFHAEFQAAMDPGSRSSGWVEGGRYATNLSRFLAVFPRNQMRIYLYEDYRANPQMVLRDLLTFLEVDPEHPIDTSRRHNETAVPRSAVLHGWRSRVLGRRRLMPLVPSPLRPLVRRLYLRYRPQVRMDPADRRMVIDYYREEIERTAELLGRDLSGWLR